MGGSFCNFLFLLKGFIDHRFTLFLFCFAFFLGPPPHSCQVWHTDCTQSLNVSIHWPQTIYYIYILFYF